MLPKGRRVSTLLFETSIKSGVRVHSPHFFVVMAKNKAITSSRMAAVAPKKVLPLAVKRNALKRKMMHSLQALLPTIPAGYALLFFAKVGAPELKGPDVTKELESLIKKIV
jgi:ribonuclease P protein component